MGIGELTPLRFRIWLDNEGQRKDIGQSELSDALTRLKGAETIERLSVNDGLDAQ